MSCRHYIYSAFGITAGLQKNVVVKKDELWNRAICHTSQRNSKQTQAPTYPICLQLQAVGSGSAGRSLTETVSAVTLNRVWLRGVQLMGNLKINQAVGLTLKMNVKFFHTASYQLILLCRCTLKVPDRQIAYAYTNHSGECSWSLQNSVI